MSRLDEEASRKRQAANAREVELLAANVNKLTGPHRQWADEALQLQREWRVLHDQIWLAHGFLREGCALSHWQVQQLLAIKEETSILAEQLEVTTNRLAASIPSLEGGGTARVDTKEKEKCKVEMQR
ncbi:hypothetical protein KFL_006500100 [Klebsormidium nitens]|uniref:Uncharacterized protein n=1 Tax=Klebsormidium nitens TaxID=105231 RepID=A0A1Y1IP11_KLENI|nr:hypothetical protein KFL_006500100 [Klebsormidium nitens]|eukprot:GAQ90516.1 hypothetical protein KFL_006500100 [Klebsormidium nitens]